MVEAASGRINRTTLIVKTNKIQSYFHSQWPSLPLLDVLREDVDRHLAVKGWDSKIISSHLFIDFHIC